MKPALHGRDNRLDVANVRGQNRAGNPLAMDNETINNGCIGKRDQPERPGAFGLVFPHLLDGEGYTTQFILFGGSGSQGASGTLQFFRQSGQALELTVR